MSMNGPASKKREEALAIFLKALETGHIQKPSGNYDSPESETTFTIAQAMRLGDAFNALVVTLRKTTQSDD